MNWLGGIVWNLARQRRPARFPVTEPAMLEQAILDRSSPIPDDVALRLDSREIVERLPTADANLLTLHSNGWTTRNSGRN